MKYKICKLQNANGNEWYQVKIKGWLFWGWAYRTEFIGGEFVVQNFRRTFDTFEDAKKYIEDLNRFKNSFKTKVVECVEL